MSRRQSANGFVDGVLRSRAPGMQKEIADKFSIQFGCGARRTMESIQRVAERKQPFLGAIVESPATHRIAEAMKLSGTRFPKCKTEVPVHVFEENSPNSCFAPQFPCQQYDFFVGYIGSGKLALKLQANEALWYQVPKVQNRSPRACLRRKFAEFLLRRH